METMYLFVGIIALVCLLGFFNEKVTKLTYEIGLMLFSTILGIVLLIGIWCPKRPTLSCLAVPMPLYSSPQSSRA